VTLAEKMTKPPGREAVVEDCCRLIDDEVKRKGGLSGAAVKMGYGVVKAFKPGFVREVVDGLLDEWVAKLEPFHVEWQKSGGGRPFGDWLGARGGEVAERLLEVTDGKARNAKSGTVKKAYEKLRPSARKHVEEAVPGLGRLVEKHG
jgi:hypothetical protein